MCRCYVLVNDWLFSKVLTVKYWCYVLVKYRLYIKVLAVKYWYYVLVRECWLCLVQSYVSLFLLFTAGGESKTGSRAHVLY